MPMASAFQKLDNSFNRRAALIFFLYLGLCIRQTFTLTSKEEFEANSARDISNFRKFRSHIFINLPHTNVMRMNLKPSGWNVGSSDNYRKDNAATDRNMSVTVQNQTNHRRYMSNRSSPNQTSNVSMLTTQHVPATKISETISKPNTFHNLDPSLNAEFVVHKFGTQFDNHGSQLKKEKQTHLLGDMKSWNVTNTIKKQYTNVRRNALMQVKPISFEGKIYLSEKSEKNNSGKAPANTQNINKKRGNIDPTLLSPGAFYRKYFLPQSQPEPLIETLTNNGTRRRTQQISKGNEKQPNPAIDKAINSANRPYIYRYRHNNPIKKSIIRLQPTGKDSREVVSLPNVNDEFGLSETSRSIHGSVPFKKVMSEKKTLIYEWDRDGKIGKRPIEQIIDELKVQSEEGNSDNLGFHYRTEIYKNGKHSELLENPEGFQKHLFLSKSSDLPLLNKNMQSANLVKDEINPNNYSKLNEQLSFNWFPQTSFSDVKIVENYNSTTKPSVNLSFSKKDFIKVQIFGDPPALVTSYQVQKEGIENAQEAKIDQYRQPQTSRQAVLFILMGLIFLTMLILLVSCAAFMVTKRRKKMRRSLRVNHHFRMENFRKDDYTDFPSELRRGKKKESKQKTAEEMESNPDNRNFKDDEQPAENYPISADSFYSTDKEIQNDNKQAHDVPNKENYENFGVEKMFGTPGEGSDIDQKKSDDSVVPDFTGNELRESSNNSSQPIGSSENLQRSRTASYSPSEQTKTDLEESISSADPSIFEENNTSREISQIGIPWDNILKDVRPRLTSKHSFDKFRDPTQQLHTPEIDSEVNQKRALEDQGSKVPDNNSRGSDLEQKDDAPELDYNKNERVGSPWNRMLVNVRTKAMLLHHA